MHLLIHWFLLTKLVFADEVDSILTSYASDYKLVKHSAMNNLPTNNKFEKSKVAVIYAVGAIDGGGTEGIISDKLVETINDVAKDDAVKSVVFRVSSPGGIMVRNRSGVRSVS